MKRHKAKSVAVAKTHPLQHPKPKNIAELEKEIKLGNSPCGSCLDGWQDYTINTDDPKHITTTTQKTCAKECKYLKKYLNAEGLSHTFVGDVAVPS